MYGSTRGPQKAGAQLIKKKWLSFFFFKPLKNTRLVFLFFRLSILLRRDIQKHIICNLHEQGLGIDDVKISIEL